MLTMLQEDIHLINKFSNVPLYSQLKTIIIDKIKSGEFAEESQIPSEQEICEKYGISRPTVRQAITELTNSGYLYKEKGKGTFVSKSKTKIDIKNYSGFTDSLLDSQEPGQRNIISMKVVESGHVIFNEGLFGTLPGAVNPGYAEITYATYDKEHPVSLNISYIPLAYFPTIIEDVKAKKPSYEILRGKYPLLPVKTKSSIEVIYSGQMEAQYLMVQSGSALIKIENILYSKSGQAVEFVICKYRADKCKLLFENNK